MTKEEYNNSLRDERWIELRERILLRDKYCCRKCGVSDVPLQVHHTYYIMGAMPWDVPDRSLRSLCSICHTKEHEGRTISSFIKIREVKKKKIKPKKLSKKGILLQKKYSTLKKAGKLKI